ncbi:MAG: hypothetical protein HRF47_15955 [Chloroflexota bacterium]|jgi:hypothetical protein
MIEVRLMGTPSCRRYQRMRDVILAEAQKLGIEIRITEIGDTASLSQVNPLSLPRLYIGDELIASQNPPKAEEVAQMLKGLSHA